MQLHNPAESEQSCTSVQNTYTICCFVSKTIFKQQIAFLCSVQNAATHAQNLTEQRHRVFSEP